MNMMKLGACIVVLVLVLMTSPADALSAREITGKPHDCLDANWTLSFDKQGWSTCGYDDKFITGFFRSQADNSKNDGIHNLQLAKCCLSSKTYAGQCIKCKHGDWRISLDRPETWSVCPSGYFLNGLYRTQRQKLHNIEQGYCCKPVNHPDKYRDCYNEKVDDNFDKEGWTMCKRPGYYVTGLFRGPGGDWLHNIHQFKCCKMFEVFSSCEEAMRDGSSKDGMYFISTNTSMGYSKVFCMRKITGCSGEGWTLVLKIDGTKKTFQYNSSLWSNKESYMTENGETGLDQNETKLPTYWSTKIKKMCVGMKVNSTIKFISFEMQAESLYDLIADGNYRKTDLSRSQWLTLVENSSLQKYCDKEGFNVVVAHSKSARVRLGILGNNEENCITPDSFIGFGGSQCKSCGGNSCGNFASWSSNDKNVRAMGYIFIA